MIGLVSRLLPSHSEERSHLYVLHKALVAIVLPGNDSSCRIYIGKNIEKDLSLGICNC